jgi:hypothetical protein
MKTIVPLIVVSCFLVLCLAMDDNGLRKQVNALQKQVDNMAWNLRGDEILLNSLVRGTNSSTSMPNAYPYK